MKKRASMTARIASLPAALAKGPLAGDAVEDAVRHGLYTRINRPLKELLDRKGFGRLVSFGAQQTHTLHKKPKWIKKPIGDAIGRGAVRTVANNPEMAPLVPVPGLLPVGIGIKGRLYNWADVPTMGQYAKQVERDELRQAAARALKSGLLGAGGGAAVGAGVNKGIDKLQEKRAKSGLMHKAPKLQVQHQAWKPTHKAWKIPKGTR